VTLEDLLIEHGAYAWEKQQHLLQLLGENPPGWFYDLDQGTIHFEDRFTFSIQLLGTESALSNTWLWAWANEGSSIPPNLLEAVKALRAYGVQNIISELTEATILLLTEQIHGHTLSMIASGICGANAYYRTPHEGGALFLLIHDEDYPVETSHPIKRIATNFLHFIQHFSISDHLRAFEHYAASHKIHIKRAGNQRILIAEDGAMLTASFNSNRLLTNLETNFDDPVE